MLCTRCGKRPAVVFVTNNNSKDAPTVGYCLSCAKELGIKPVEDLISKMGISDEDLENVQDQMNSLMQGGDLSQLMEQLGADNLAEQMDDFARMMIFLTARPRSLLSSITSSAEERLPTETAQIKAPRKKRKKKRKENTSASIARI